MHIPDHMIEGLICPVTATVAAAGLTITARFALKQKKGVEAGKFAAVSALLFAAQMVNFNVLSGVSGHLMGGVLAAALLGVAPAILAMSLVLAVQAVFFADGGILMLGTNVVNMALIGTGLGGGLYFFLKDRFSSGFLARSLAITLAAWFSVLASSFACAAEIALSGSTLGFSFILDMLGVHSLIGLAEAFITLSLFYMLKEQGEEFSLPSVLAAAVAAAVVLLPFASNLPDGLEWAAEKYGMDSASPESLLSFLSGSAVNEAISAFIGLALTFILALASHRLILARQKK